MNSEALILDEEGTRNRAIELLEILERDRRCDGGLLECDNYLHGKHNDPWKPENADREYRLLVKRAVTNLTPLVVSTPAQACYVDGFRSGVAGAEGNAPEWDAWQGSGMDKKQASVYRAAFTYGHSFVLAEQDDEGTARMKGLSPLRTAVGYDDPANDDAPIAAIYIKSWPRTTKGKEVLGVARMWDETDEYLIRFKGTCDVKSVTHVGAHGNTECPVERFSAYVDLDGRTTGLVAPLIPLQDRINQTVFDLLVAQTYGSFKVRWATGMAPPIEVDPETGDPIVDENGEPKQKPIRAHASRFMMADDPDTRFGTLDETPLDGYINAIDMGIRHLAALTQTPPHHLLGQIANLSAEALNAAETALARKVEEFQHSFGESWERVFRLVGQLDGNSSVADDRNGEVIWRDMSAVGISQVSDALGKLSENLGIPKRGLWHRVPGTTQTEIEDWEKLREEEPDVALANGNRRAVAPREAADPDLGEDFIPAQPSSAEEPAA